MNRLLLLLCLCFAGRSIVAQPISWITDCSEKNFCLNQGSCTQGVVFMAEKAVTNCNDPDISYSYKIDVNNDGGIEIQSADDTLSGNFAKGTHKIIWRAVDNCGKVTQCTYLFHVKDCAPPNLICNSGLIQTLDLPLCDAHFTVNQFILSLSDNCIPASQIERGMRRTGTGTGFPTEQELTFGLCDDGLNPIELWVRDNNGLVNICNTSVFIQNGNPECDCGENADIQFNGCVRSANNTRMANYRTQATVKSPDGVQNPFSKVKTTITTDSCYSTLLIDIPTDSSYQAIVRAYRPDAVLNGVTTFDLVLISKHILGIEALGSAYQLEAADVNNSNTVSTFDIVETRKLILGILDTFSQVPSWRLVRPLADPSILSGFTALQDTYLIQLPNFHGDTTFQGLNFVGIKYGDVNYSAAFAGASEERTETEPILLKAADRWLNAGEEATIQFRLDGASQPEGWQLSIAADPNSLQLLEVEGLPEEDYLLGSNELRAVSYQGFIPRESQKDDLFTLKVRALQSTQLSHALHLNSGKLKPQTYFQGQDHQYVTRPLSLQFNSNKVDFLALSPNPFSEAIDFNLQMNEPSTAALEIFTIDGKRVYSENFDLELGTQSIRLSADSLPSGKIFFYRFKVNGEVFSGKMVRI